MKPGLKVLHYLYVTNQISKFVIDQVMFDIQLENVLIFPWSHYECLKYCYMYLYIVGESLNFMTKWLPTPVIVGKDYYTLY